MRGISPGIQCLTKITPVLIVLVAVTLFVVMDIVDLANQHYPAGFLQSVLELDPGTARYTLTSMAGALGTLVAITITLVLIVVQLTANRYTPKLIDLFIEAKVNLLLLAVFVFTIIYCFYVAHTIKPDFAPRAGSLVCLALMTVCLTSLIPYLFFVLDFMEPRNIINKIESRALAYLQYDSPKVIAGRKAKLRFSQSLEQITDIAKGSLRINDTSVALSRVVPPRTSDGGEAISLRNALHKHGTSTPTIPGIRSLNCLVVASRLCSGAWRAITYAGESMLPRRGCAW